ncbi:MAG: hypothetical protein GYA57_15585 [Myxococcales bacterium]|nr:hypothetical protein [Myxococcales bacterium]
MKRSRMALFLALSALTWTGCGDDDGGTPDDGGTTETTDAETGADADADADADEDTGPGADADADEDTGPGADTDAEPDAEPDASTPVWDAFCRRAESCALATYDECAVFGRCVESVGRPDVLEPFFACAAASCETLDIEHGPCASILIEAPPSTAATEYASACEIRMAELGCGDLECWLPNWYNDATIAAMRACLAETTCDAVYECRHAYDCS